VQNNLIPLFSSIPFSRLALPLAAAREPQLPSPPPLSTAVAQYCFTAYEVLTEDALSMLLRTLRRRVPCTRTKTCRVLSGNGYRSTGLGEGEEDLYAARGCAAATNFPSTRNRCSLLPYFKRAQISPACKPW
jgi:hypothetical protein